jgi:hypothetical protein
MLYVSAKQKAVSLNLHRYNEDDGRVSLPVRSDATLDRWGAAR